MSAVISGDTQHAVRGHRREDRPVAARTTRQLRTHIVTATPDDHSPQNVTGALVILLDRLCPEAEVDTEAAEATAMTVPIGAAP